MRTVLSIPLFLYLLIAANVAMLAAPEAAPLINVLLLELTLPSGGELLITVSDLLILASVLALYVETLKATRTSNMSIVDHALSLFVFIAFLIEFLIVEQVGNATFLIMMTASLMDVIMGFTVTISTARRDLALGV